MVNSIALFPQTAALVETWKYFSSSSYSSSPKNTTTRQSLVPNFRQVAEVSNLYRSNNFDDLVTLLNYPPDELYEAERFILYNATLWMDLRSPEEQDEKKLHTLATLAPGGPLEEIVIVLNNNGTTSDDDQLLHQQLAVVVEDDTESSPRKLVYVNLLDMSRVTLSYVKSHWRDDEDADIHNNNAGEGNNSTNSSAHSKEELLFQDIHEHGLAGLYEIILDSNILIGIALKIITIHLEQTVGGAGGQVVFYCSVGKDRTGMIAMLSQSLLGVSNEAIVEDFAKSASVQSWTESKMREVMSSGISKVFAQAPPEAMVQTLEYLRNHYGSVEGYLESVGFDASWQRRFRAVAAGKGL
jgi:hypothetical protein